MVSNTHLFTKIMLKDIYKIILRFVICKNNCKENV